MKHACDLIFMYPLQRSTSYITLVPKVHKVCLSCDSFCRQHSRCCRDKYSVYIVLTQLSMNCSFQCRYLGSYYVSVNTERSICQSVAYVAGGYLRLSILCHEPLTGSPLIALASYIDS